MFHWVNTNQLPLQGMKMQTLKLISDIFGGRTIASGETVWTPDMKARKLTRVLITGKAIAGAKKESATPGGQQQRVRRGPVEWERGIAAT